MKNLLELFIFTIMICSNETLLSCFPWLKKSTIRQVYVAPTEKTLAEQACLKNLQEQRIASENQTLLVSEQISNNIFEISRLKNIANQKSLEYKISLCQQSIELLQRELRDNSIINPNLKTRWKEQIKLFQKYENQLEKELTKQQNI